MSDIPQAICEAASKTWFSGNDRSRFAVPPLTYLTTECIRNHGHATTWSPGRGFYNAAADARKESSLSVSEHTEATKRLLQLAKRYFPPAFEPWKAFYVENFWSGVSETSWPYKSEYDIELRRNAFPHSAPKTKIAAIDDIIQDRVAMRQKELWAAQPFRSQPIQNHAAQPVSHFRQNSGNSFRQSFLPPHNNMPYQLREHQGGFRADSQPPPYAQLPTSHRQDAVPRQGGTGNTRGRPNFRNHPSRSFRSELFCFVCGAEGHVSAACEASVQANGAPIFVSRIGRYPTRPSGEPFCYAFNTTGCPYAPCNRAHVCSLCGGQSHDARSRACPRQ